MSCRLVIPPDLSVALFMGAMILVVCINYSHTRLLTYMIDIALCLEDLKMCLGLPGFPLVISHS